MRPALLTWRAHLAWWVLASATVAALVGLFALPVANVVGKGLVIDGELHLQEFASTLTSAKALKAMWTTLALATAGSAGSLVLGVPAAYALFRLRWPGVTVVRAIASTPFALPTVVVAASFSALLGKGGALGSLGIDQSVAAIILALVFYNTSLVMRVVGSAWEGLDPGRMLAARTLGASRLRALVHVTLPGLAPSIASAAVLAFMFCASSFGVVLVLGGGRVRTLETGIYQAINSSLDVTLAAGLAVLQLTVVVAALGISARLQGGTRSASLTQTRDGRRRAMRSDLPIVAASLGGLAAMYALPLGALVERSLRDRGGYSLHHYAALFDPPVRGTLPTSVIEAAARSATVASVATVMSVSVGLVITWLHLTRPRATRPIATLAMLPLGVSSVMTGLGILLTLNTTVAGLDLRGSEFLVPLGQAIVALPFVVRVMLSAARQLDPRLAAAAHTLGAGSLRVWTRVHLPLLKGPLGVAAAFAAAMSFGEFGATAFLARPDSPTLTTAIVRLLGRPGADNIGTAFAAAVLLAVVTASIMAVAERLRPRLGGSW